MGSSNSTLTNWSIGSKKRTACRRHFCKNSSLISCSTNRDDYSKTCSMKSPLTSLAKKKTDPLEDLDPDQQADPDLDQLADQDQVADLDQAEDQDQAKDPNLPGDPDPDQARGLDQAVDPGQAEDRSQAEDQSQAHQHRRALTDPLQLKVSKLKRTVLCWKNDIKAFDFEMA